MHTRHSRLQCRLVISKNDPLLMMLTHPMLMLAAASLCVSMSFAAASASEQGALIAGGNNAVRSVTGQTPLAVCSETVTQPQDFGSCDRSSTVFNMPRAAEGEKHYEDYGPGNS